MHVRCMHDQCMSDVQAFCVTVPGQGCGYGENRFRETKELEGNQSSRLIQYKMHGEGWRVSGKAVE